MQEYAKQTMLGVGLVLGLVGCAMLGPTTQFEPHDPVAEMAEKLQGAPPANGGARAPASLHRPFTNSPAPSVPLVMGMSMDEVLEAWGAPTEVEAAGDTHSGNQRWLYAPGLAHSVSRLQDGRTVYFESGRVSGWTLGGPSHSMRSLDPR